MYKWADVSSISLAHHNERSLSFQAGSQGISTFLHIAVGSAISAVYTTFAISAAGILFSIARICLPIIYQIPFASLFLRPFTAHFLKGQWTIFLPLTYIHLLVRSWALAFTTFLIWETADSMFEKVVEDVRTPSSSFTRHLLIGLPIESRSVYLFFRSRHDLGFWPHLKRQNFQILRILRAPRPCARPINKCCLAQSRHLWRPKVIAQPMGLPCQRECPSSGRGLPTLLASRSSSASTACCSSTRNTQGCRATA